MTQHGPLNEQHTDNCAPGSSHSRTQPSPSPRFLPQQRHTSSNSHPDAEMQDWSPSQTQHHLPFPNQVQEKSGYCSLPNSEHAQVETFEVSPHERPSSARSRRSTAKGSRFSKMNQNSKVRPATSEQHDQVHESQAQYHTHPESTSYKQQPQTEHEPEAYRPDEQHNNEDGLDNRPPPVAMIDSFPSLPSAEEIYTHGTQDSSFLDTSSPSEDSDEDFGEALPYFAIPKVPDHQHHNKYRGYDNAVVFGSVSSFSTSSSELDYPSGQPALKSKGQNKKGSKSTQKYQEAERKGKHSRQIMLSPTTLNGTQLVEKKWMVKPSKLQFGVHSYSHNTALSVTITSTTHLPLRLYAQIIAASPQARSSFVLYKTPPSLHGASVSTIKQYKSVHRQRLLLDGKGTRHTIWVGFQAVGYEVTDNLRSYSASLCLSPTKDVSTQSSNLITCVPLSACVGYTRLQLPRNAQVLSFQATGASVHLRHFPFRNAGCIPLDLSLVLLSGNFTPEKHRSALPPADGMQDFRLNRSHLTVPPNAIEQVEVSFAPSRGPGFYEANLLIVIPSSACYRIGLQGTSHILEQDWQTHVRHSSAPQGAANKARERGVTPTTSLSSLTTVRAKSLSHENADLLLPSSREIGVRPDVVVFGRVAPGSEKTRTLKVFSRKSKKLTIQLKVEEQANPSPYKLEVMDTSPETSQKYILGPHSHILVSVTFRPFSPGIVQDSILVSTGEQPDVVLEHILLIGEGHHPSSSFS